MSRFPDDVISAGNSKRVVVGNGTNTASIPTTRDGVTAQLVLLAASANTFIRYSVTSSLTCSTSTDIFVVANFPHKFNVAGYGYVCALSDVTGFLGITAMEIG